MQKITGGIPAAQKNRLFLIELKKGSGNEFTMQIEANTDNDAIAIGLVQIFKHVYQKKQDEIAIMRALEILITTVETLKIEIPELNDKINGQLKAIILKNIGG